MQAENEPPELKVLSHLEHNHFATHSLPEQHHLIAWCNRVGHVIDVLPSLAQFEQPFHGVIDRYQIGDLTFTDCSSDPLTLHRSIARISTDNIRDYVFQIFIQGEMTFTASSTQLGNRPASVSIIALDLNQPARMQRSTCRVLSLFVPRVRVEAIFPDAESLHGRVLQNTSALTQLLIQHLGALTTTLPSMDSNEASIALECSIQLLLAAFAKQTKLSGYARAAARTAMLGQTRNFIKANLDNDTLSPESVLQALKLPRATIYRLFEHEGGLGAYIRRCRLRAAADRLISQPTLPVLEIAYSLGFGSPSDFTRAFRREHGMSPRDFRIMALSRLIDTPT